MTNLRRPVLPSLRQDRLDQRLEHFMTEITATQLSVTVPPSPPRKEQNGAGTLRWRVLAGVAAVAVATVGVFMASSVLGGPSGQGPAAFAFHALTGDTVSIRVVDSRVAAKEMTRQLHAEGLTNVSVQTQAATAQLVGVWTGVVVGAKVPESVGNDLGQQLEGYTSTLELPAHFTGEIHLFIGRSAKPGEQPTTEGEINALAPGGLLHCTRLSGTDPDLAAARLSRVGYTVHWIKGSLRRGGPTAQQAAIAPQPGSRVVYASVPAGALMDWPANSKDVFLRTAQPGSTAYDQLIWRGFPPSQRTSGAPDFSDCPATP
jgi:hypothetical protein